MGMTWKYIRDSKRLNIYGADGVKDIQEIKKLIEEGKIPSDLGTLFYQRDRHSSVGMLFRGRYLENLLKPETEEAEGTRTKPSFRSILRQINESNTRQTIYSGLLIYATNAKRFMFVIPKKRNNVYGLLGDNPRDGETPPETVCRVAKEDCDFELTPNCLVALTPVEIDGTTYFGYLVLSNHEFKPSLSARFAASTWRSYEAMEELTLHQSVTELFEKDTKLQRLIKPIEVDFEKLIDEILHAD